jgi:hypothetical protein
MTKYAIFLSKDVPAITNAVASQAECACEVFSAIGQEEFIRGFYVAIDENSQEFSFAAMKARVRGVVEVDAKLQNDWNQKYSKLYQQARSLSNVVQDSYSNILHETSEFESLLRKIPEFREFDLVDGAGLDRIFERLDVEVDAVSRISDELQEIFDCEYFH